MRRTGVKSPRNRAVLAEETPNLLGRAQPLHTLEMGWKKEVRVPSGTGSPLYSWETRYPDMSGGNYLSNFKNFRNHLKSQYPTDFGVGPIEYIYMCVCVGYMDKLRKTKNIYGLKPLESKSMNKILYK
jgi:hypothetical protein